ncbi:MAG: 16S rRNA (guanine(966)-N(2))-methyltransferase RsmD [Fastidiosipilaceae bacterium]
MPRVIAGGAGGRTLRAPEGEGTRPTGDRAKEAMFSVIGARMSFAEARVLDLFAGSGQLGIEALSRGAKHCVFVERSAAAAKIIRDNLQACDFTKQGEVRKGTIKAALRALSERKRDRTLVSETERLSVDSAELEGFDLVFMDPPYHEADLEFAWISQRLVSEGLLNDGALLVLEHDPAQHSVNQERGIKLPGKDKNKSSDRGVLDLDVTHLKLVKHCKYGMTVVSFFMYSQLYDDGLPDDVAVERSQVNDENLDLSGHV